MTTEEELKPYTIFGDIDSIEKEDLRHQLIWLDPYRDTEYEENRRPTLYDTCSDMEVLACGNVLKLLADDGEWNVRREMIILTKTEDQKDLMTELIQMPDEPEGNTIVPVYTLNEWDGEKKPIIVFTFGQCMFDEERHELVQHEPEHDADEVNEVLDAVTGMSTRLIIVGHMEYASKLNKYWNTVADICSENIMETYN